MKRNRDKWVRGVAGCLALMAALACSVMPGGWIPKVAGKCGQALCNCAPEPLPSPTACTSCNVKHAHPAGGLTLVTTAISGAEAPGLAFQVVFSGLVAPDHMLILEGTSSEESLSPESRGFTLSSVSSEIATPPPKA